MKVHKEGRILNAKPTVRSMAPRTLQRWEGKCRKV